MMLRCLPFGNNMADVKRLFSGNGEDAAFNL